MIRRLAAALLLATAAPAAAAPADDLASVLADHWRWWLAVHPESASALGEHGGDGRLRDLSLAAADAEAKTAQALLTRLQAIPDAGLTPAQATDKAILARLLAEQIEENGFGARQMLFTTYYGWHEGFAGLAERSPFRTRGDYESYLARLAAYPAQNRAALAVTAKGVAEGFVQPCAVLDGYAARIAGAIAPTVEGSRFYKPFTGARPADATPADWAALQARAKALITATVEPEYRRFADYFTRDYLPHCRASVGASALPDGARWYALQVRIQTTTGLTPDEIHRIGLDEVARIGAAMDALARAAGYPDRAAFVDELRTNPKYYATTPEALLAAAALEAKRHDGLLPRYFGRLPRLPYGIAPIPAAIAEGTTTAYYSPGRPEAGIAGTYFVNTAKLAQRPLWELPALTAHEAVPGHHLQIALQQELDLPPFRRHAAPFNAFVEGWALYTEYLGEEMGLYDTPEKRMGRLSYEMWRACRLVVDTGLHAKGWSKTQAVAFMKANTALTDANIEAEVNRYISWPAQALGYKLGELRIRALRLKAESVLGPRFDLAAFHDALLSDGAEPLDLLEARMTAWIAARETTAKN